VPVGNLTANGWLAYVGTVRLTPRASTGLLPRRSWARRQKGRKCVTATTTTTTTSCQICTGAPDPTICGTPSVMDATGRRTRRTASGGTNSRLRTRRSIVRVGANAGHVERLEVGGAVQLRRLPNE